ncbi:phosphotransferase [Henriciella aquimarina]|uniref:phosphotransferase n=1 Tax=Henriciella aquimarina TaxID=545261 RepID=UPI0009FDB731|nr:phosphotransferase [Henriciella aquimarina]
MRDYAPDLAGETVTQFQGEGTDNYLFRIGTGHCLRVPKSEASIPGLVSREAMILPRLEEMPLETPGLVVKGLFDAPDSWPWLLCTWVDGETMEDTAWTASPREASRLALFLLELQGLDRTRAAAAGPDNHYRGVDLQARDGPTRQAITALADEFEEDALLAVWDKALAAKPCRAEDQTWLHGDLNPGNILVRGDGLAGVLDWGLSGVGDPACDLMAGYTLFNGEARPAFASAMGASASDWDRGRGWALSVAAIALAEYRGSGAPCVARARHTLREVLSEPV